MSRTVTGLVVEYWGECALSDGTNGWCGNHDSRWSSKVNKYCDEIRSFIDFAEHILESKYVGEMLRKKWDEGYESGYEDGSQ